MTGLCGKGQFIFKRQYIMVISFSSTLWFIITVRSFHELYVLVRDLASHSSPLSLVSTHVVCERLLWCTSLLKLLKFWFKIHSIWKIWELLVLACTQWTLRFGLHTPSLGKFGRFGQTWRKPMWRLNLYLPADTKSFTIYIKHKLSATIYLMLK